GAIETVSGAARISDNEARVFRFNKILQFQFNCMPDTPVVNSISDFDPESDVTAALQINRVDALFQAVDDERAVIARHALVYAAEGRRVVIRGHAAEAGNDRDVLLAVDGIADDAALVAGAVAMVPQLGTGLGIISVHRAA